MLCFFLTSARIYFCESGLLVNPVSDTFFFLAIFYRPGSLMMCFQRNLPGIIFVLIEQVEDDTNESIVLTRPNSLVSTNSNKRFGQIGRDLFQEMCVLFWSKCNEKCFIGPYRIYYQDRQIAIHSYERRILPFIWLLFAYFLFSIPDPLDL